MKKLYTVSKNTSKVSGGNPTVLYSSWHKTGTAASEGCECPEGRGRVLHLWIPQS